MITTPILISDSGDLSIFGSLALAAKYIESLDVTHNVFTAYDTEGRLLKLSVKSVGPRQRVMIEAAETEPGHQDELKQVLLNFYSVIGAEKEWLADASLPDLVHRAHSYMLSGKKGWKSNFRTIIIQVLIVVFLGGISCPGFGVCAVFSGFLIAEPLARSMMPPMYPNSQIVYTDKPSGSGGAMEIRRYTTSDSVATVDTW